MPLPNWKFFAGVIGIGGIAVGSMGLLLHSQMDKFANKTNFVQRAIKITKNEPSVKQLIGENMILGKISFADGFAELKDTSAKVKVPLKGSIDEAFIYAYARRKDTDAKFTLIKLEAEFSKVKGKKLIILDRSSDDPETDDAWETQQIELEQAKEKEKNNIFKKKPADLERERINAMTESERKQYYLEKMKAMTIN